MYDITEVCKMFGTALRSDARYEVIVERLKTVAKKRDFSS